MKWYPDQSLKNAEELLNLNALRQRENGRHLPDNIFKCIFFLNENALISLKFVPMGPINNIPALVRIMAWHPPGNKSLSEPMVVSLMNIYIRHSASMSQQVYGHF